MMELWTCLTRLEGDGGFRSEESLRPLREAEIIVTLGTLSVARGLTQLVTGETFHRTRPRGTRDRARRHLELPSLERRDFYSDLHLGTASPFTKRFRESSRRRW